MQVAKELNKKTAGKWIKSVEWLGQEREKVKGADGVERDRSDWTYFQVEMIPGSSKLEMKPNVAVTVSIIHKDKPRVVEVFRAGHCSTCHSTTHSKNGCRWWGYAKELGTSWTRD